MQSPFHFQGDLVFVNYARAEDFEYLVKEKGMNLSGRIVIAKYAKIFRGDKVMIYFISRLIMEMLHGILLPNLIIK